MRFLYGCVDPRGCQVVSALGIFLQLRAFGPLCGADGGVFKPCGMARMRMVPLF